MTTRRAAKAAARRQGEAVPGGTDFSLIARVEEQIRDAALSDLDVLISGGSDRVRKLLARLIHRRSSRGDGPFVVLDRSGLEHLLRQRQDQNQDGIDRGPLAQFPLWGSAFIQELGDLNPDLQERLSQLLQRRAFERSRWGARGEVRILAGTAYRLHERLSSEDFSPELFY